MAYGVELQRWEEKKEFKKIMMDYTRQVFKLDFCTPRYLILRKLGLDKLKIVEESEQRYEEKTRIKKSKFNENMLAKERKGRKEIIVQQRKSELLQQKGMSSGGNRRCERK